MKKRPEYNLNATGENLRRLREEKHFSAEDVRRYMGLASVQSVYSWERGENFPAADNLLALAELYEVSPTRMLVKENYGLFKGKGIKDVFLCAQDIDYLIFI